MLQQPVPRRRLKAFTLPEMLVVTALMSAISLFTVVLYKTAIGDYESSTMSMSMQRYARKVSQKLGLLIATATNRTVNEQAFADTTKVPPATGQLVPGLAPQHELNFLSTANYIKSTPTECAYAFDDGDVTPGYTQFFRYRIGWTGNASLGSLPPNSVFLERRTVPLDASGNVLDSVGQFLNGSYRQSLATNIGNINYQMTYQSTIQVRITVYSIDPVTGRGLDGQLMRTMNRRNRVDVATGTAKTYELLTSYPIPTASIKK